MSAIGAYSTELRKEVHPLEIDFAKLGQEATSGIFKDQVIQAYTLKALGNIRPLVDEINSQIKGVEENFSACQIAINEKIQRITGTIINPGNFPKTSLDGEHNALKSLFAPIQRNCLRLQEELVHKEDQGTADKSSLAASKLPEVDHSGVSSFPAVSPSSEALPGSSSVAKIPPAIPSSLLQKQFKSSLAKGKKVIAIIRHAERFQVAKGTHGVDVSLTPQGVKDSELLGQSLMEISLTNVHTSPISRCIHTSEELLKGSGKSHSIDQQTALGMPGPFIADTDLAGPVFLEKSLLEIAKSVAEGEKVPGMWTLAEGSKVFLDYALQVQGQATLMVSHDIIIALLNSFLFEDKNVEKYMPDFLGGFFIEVDHERLTIFHKEEVHHLSRKRLDEMLA